MKWYFVLNQSAPAVYLEAAKVAVLSCKERTTLSPNCLWDGEDTEFTAWLLEHGVAVHKTSVPFLPKIIEQQGTRGLTPKNARGAYLRVMIPQVEQDDEFVLYTDADVMFMADPVPYLGTFRPQYIAATLESRLDRTQYFNSGVMLMNVPALHRVFPDFLSMMASDLPHWIGFSPNDQGALNYFFRGVWDMLDVTINWKPYWGIEPNASIIHFHGARPAYVVDFLAGGGAMGAKRTHLEGRDRKAMDFYIRKYFEWLALAFDDLTSITALETAGRMLYCTVQPGAEASTYHSYPLEITVDQRRSERHLMVLPPKSEAAFTVCVPLPADVLDGGEHTVRARLSFLPDKGRTILLKTPSIGQDDITGGYCSLDSSKAKGAEISSCRTRLVDKPKEGLKAFYIGFHASKRLVQTGDTLSPEQLGETEFPPIFVGRRSVDLARSAVVRMPEGLPLFADWSVEDRMARALFANGTRRERLQLIMADDDHSVRVLEGSCSAIAIPQARLLAFADYKDFPGWLLGTLSRLELFQECPDCEGVTWLSGPLSDLQRAALAIFGIDKNALTIVNSDEFVRVERLFLAIDFADEPPVFRIPLHSWFERSLSARLGPGCQDGAVALVSSAMLADPKGAALVDELRRSGWRILNGDKDRRPDKFFAAIRNAKLLTVLDSKLGALLALASPSAVVQDIQFLKAVDASVTYRMCIAKSLGVAVVLLPDEEYRVREVADQIVESANRLLSANVATMGLRLGAAPVPERFARRALVSRLGARAIDLYRAAKVKLNGSKT